MKWLWIIPCTIVGLILLVAVIGSLLPKKHTASRTAKINKPADAVWAVIEDHANEPTWRGDIKAKEKLPDRNGHEVWREARGRGDSLTLETLEKAAPTGVVAGRMVGRIADENLPFGGTWTYVIKPVDSQRCTVTITEDGEVYNPIFRFVARFIIGHLGSIDGYLTALSRKFGQEPELAD